MKVPRGRIAGLLAKQTLQKGVVKPFAQEIAAYLLEEGRVSELDSILRDVQSDWADAGYVEVTASSVYPLSEAVRLDIKMRVKKFYPSAKQIIISELRNPEIIGGVRLNFPNQQLDLSIATKLNKFKQLTMSGKD